MMPSGGKPHSMESFDNFAMKIDFWNMASTKYARFDISA